MQADIQAIETVAEWFRGLGLGNGSDRLHKYICEIRKQAPLPDKIEEIAEMGFVYLEAADFCSVYRAYKDSVDSKLIGKLERALRGCSSAKEESSQNNDPRNTMFELSLAANFKLRGVDVELGEPDLVLNFPKGRYVLECKRPFRENSLRANVKDAESQLRASLKDGEHGVIAISLDRIINPGTSVLGVEVGERNTLGTVHGTLQEDLHRRAVRLMGTLSTLSFSPRIAALMFDISTPFLTDKGEEGLAHGSRFYPTDEPRAIKGKLRGIRRQSLAFTYLEGEAMDHVLKNDFSSEVKAEIDRMNRLAQMPVGFFVAYSKQPLDKQ